MSCGALQGHEEMHHKSPVISGYGNISQELHIDYGFIMSQHGNFSLNSNLKLVAQGSLQWNIWLSPFIHTFSVEESVGQLHVHGLGAPLLP